MASVWRRALFGACAAAAAASASSPSAPSLLRVALYVGSGASANSAGNYSEALAQLVAQGVFASLSLMSDADVGAKLAPSAFDVVVFPGGTGSGEFAGIGEAGQDAVRAFVAAGKGYAGTCAGGFLALTATCCDVPVPGYCNGNTGCTNSSHALALIDFASVEPWDRGHGMVTMVYEDAAVAMLKLDPKVYGGGRNTSILYYQGPIADRNYPQGFTSGATFTSEIHLNHATFTTGQMVGTTGLAFSTYGAGKGRVLISPPHPEETVPRLNDVIAAYVLWAGKAI
jgi:putative intracellular protease/amidase